MVIITRFMVQENVRLLLLILLLFTKSFFKSSLYSVMLHWLCQFTDQSLPRKEALAHTKSHDSPHANEVGLQARVVILLTLHQQQNDLAKYECIIKGWVFGLREFAVDVDGSHWVGLWQHVGTLNVCIMDL